MFRQIFHRLAIVTGAMFISAAALAADPTIQQVYEQANAGHLAQAQQMMTTVLRDHPNSGKAHFVEAELLARQGRLSNAQNELASAERLEPGLPFAKPAAVQELKSLLATGSSRAVSNNASFAPTAAAADATHGGFSWNILIVALAAVALFAYFINRRARAVMQPVQSSPSYGGGYSGYSAGTPAYGSGPIAPAGGGIGSGILGSLATGAAVGAGVVAGEALMHRVFDGSSQSGLASTGFGTSSAASGDWSSISPDPVQNYDMGGNDFGLNDDSSWDDTGGSGDDWS